MLAIPFCSSIDEKTLHISKHCHFTNYIVISLLPQNFLHPVVGYVMVDVETVLHPQTLALHALLAYLFIIVCPLLLAKLNQLHLP